MIRVIQKPLFWVIILALGTIVLIIVTLNLEFLQKNNFNIFTFLTKPKPGSCLILEEKYCKQAQFITDPNNSSDFLAVYSIPSNTALFAPVDGEFSIPKFFFKNASGKFINYPGAAVTVYKNRAAEVIENRYDFLYFKEKDRPNSVSEQIKKGDIIGIISNKSIDYLGDYNLAVRIIKSHPSQKGTFESNVTLLKSLLTPEK